MAFNRLRGPPRPTRPDQAWVDDSPRLPMWGGGRRFLASWQGACSRKVVGLCRGGGTQDLRETLPEDLVSEAWRRALAVRRPAAGLLVHADQVPPRRHLGQPVHGPPLSEIAG